MRLNHIDLYSADVAATARFFLDHLDFLLIDKRGNDQFYQLTDGSGLVFVISPPIEKLGGADQVALDAQTYHIGFLLESSADVDGIFGQLATAGFSIAEPRNMHGAYAFYVTIPGNILVEFAHRPVT
ncbi:VOC family protein [Pararhizobium sp. LjRoot238]|uniref:VOC family protein n=1 Tax=Pararhizobium sp. LjRoot238 TaxID=3342293 RepID=UPI003ECC3026